MPAAAVIPAPIAYTKVVVVKKLVVGSMRQPDGAPIGVLCRHKVVHFVDGQGVLFTGCPQVLTSLL